MPRALKAPNIQIYVRYEVLDISITILIRFFLPFHGAQSFLITLFVYVISETVLLCILIIYTIMHLILFFT